MTANASSGQEVRNPGVSDIPDPISGGADRFIGDPGGIRQIHHDGDRG
jgi:hypothetical protein